MEVELSYLENANGKGPRECPAPFYSPKPQGYRPKTTANYPCPSKPGVLVQDDPAPKVGRLHQNLLRNWGLGAKPIYTAMRNARGNHIISNGDQTDTIAQFILEGRTFEDAVLTLSHEPDRPHYTPRISGVLSLDKDPLVRLAKVFRDQHDPNQSCYAFYIYRTLTPGFGVCLYTYQSNEDPLPYFAEDPFIVRIGNSIDEISEYYWELLDRRNRVALAVKVADMNSVHTESRVINRHEV